MLRGEAWDWWLTMQSRGECDGSWTWEVFRAELLEVFFLEILKDKLRERFLMLQQGDRTVKEYKYDFNRLSQFAPELIASDGDKMRLFIRGLNPPIHRFVMIVQCKSFRTAVAVASLYEEDHPKSRDTCSLHEGKKRNNAGQGQLRPNKQIKTILQERSSIY